MTAQVPIRSGAVLSAFSHTSYPKAPEFCLAKFDELKAIGLQAFTKKYEPYWDIPLNENRPKPVTELPGVQEQGTGSQERAGGRKRGPLNPESRIPTPASPVQLSFLTPDLGPLFRQPPAPTKPAASEFPPAARKPRRLDGVDPDTYELLKLLLEEQGVITSGDAQDLTKLDAAGVRPCLQRLVEDGLAVTEGQRRGMRYRRIGRPPTIAALSDEVGAK